jgi:hypothetical protein
MRLTTSLDSVLNSPVNEKLLFGVPIDKPIVAYALVHSKITRKTVNQATLVGSINRSRSIMQMRKMAKVRGQMSNASCLRMCQPRYLLQVSFSGFVVGERELLYLKTSCFLPWKAGSVSDEASGSSGSYTPRAAFRSFLAVQVSPLSSYTFVERTDIAIALLSLTRRMVPCGLTIDGHIHENLELASCI